MIQQYAVVARDVEDLRRQLWAYPLRSLSETTGVPVQMLSDIRNGAAPRHKTLEKMQAGVEAFESLDRLPPL